MGALQYFCLDGFFNYVKLINMEVTESLAVTFQEFTMKRTFQI